MISGRPGSLINYIVSPEIVQAWAWQVGGSIIFLISLPWQLFRSLCNFAMPSVGWHHGESNAVHDLMYSNEVSVFP
jgi:hypothetical protein